MQQHTSCFPGCTYQCNTVIYRERNGKLRRCTTQTTSNFIVAKAFFPSQLASADTTVFTGGLTCVCVTCAPLFHCNSIFVCQRYLQRCDSQTSTDKRFPSCSAESTSSEIPLHILKKLASVDAYYWEFVEIADAASATQLSSQSSWEIRALGERQRKAFVQATGGARP